MLVPHSCVLNIHCVVRFRIRLDLYRSGVRANEYCANSILHKPGISPPLTGDVPIWMSLTFATSSMCLIILMTRAMTGWYTACVRVTLFGIALGTLFRATGNVTPFAVS